jgi:predicted cupin superfamily sugar epimerase
MLPAAALAVDAARAIDLLGLQPHPEGGWYAETWRAGLREGPPGAPPAARGAGTAIYFLLRAGERSHWHRVDAAEVWHHYSGGPLELHLAEGDRGPVTTVILGPDLEAGQRPQAVVPAGWWQAAQPVGADVLVGCTVAPAFVFEGFELAPEGWSPGPAPARD